jgi:hypothetical protein
LSLWWGMDALSKLLKAIKLDSAFFYNGEFSVPWYFRSPNSCKLAPILDPHARGALNTDRALRRFAPHSEPRRRQSELAFECPIESRLGLVAHFS